MNDPQHITQLKDDLVAAIQRKDVAAFVETFADKTVMYQLNPPLRFRTGDNAPGAGGIEAWFATFEGAISLTYQELEITVGDEVAFCHCLEHLRGARTDGTKTDIWYRETLGLRKLDGIWKITHQHQSFPTYMDGSQKAATDLQP
ncbi:nuclear transport factor 2 family protein [Spirosoma sp. BT702]|uniref:Nuclear transport factor 2 family protein n=1 Tax=Spirosoma profusum TaxID=2771354 RepID=A0A927AV91_9BACT|nr:nuclear transport factor 2 family protein [Spirosoma profusum]MBD2705047.1 nuclear transport factor 2 family protein [Spirosoma profusum]